MFVLNKPRVVVIAMGGETPASDWKIGIDFTKAKYSTLDAQTKKNSVNL